MRRAHVALTALLAVSWVLAIVNGCSATGDKPRPTTSGTGGGTTTTTTTGGTGGMGGMGLFLDAGGDADAAEEVQTNPCGSQCGPVELCDPAHLGYDDNCNGLVDEGCACNPGAVHWCFEGDPSYRNAPGCFDGVESCSELGVWGPCIGGVHAIPPDNCFQNDTTECHAITSPPYATIDLKTGTGNFSANAVSGSETYTVTCPTGVSQCPGVMPPESFTALQSGEYNVTYTKMVAGDPNALTCSFPLFVGAPGLRVELSWEHTTADPGVDLDLSMHQPMNTDPWGYSPGVEQDCNYSNCKVTFFAPPQDVGSPHWFPDTNVAPQPVNWDLQPALSDNTCYNDPRGVGAQWQALGIGCHNPRLDVDNITCNYAITDPTNGNFCTPENINVDYPPSGEWLRVGVHYYYNNGETYDVHPEVKIFCNGALSADLGPHGYYTPETAVTFTAADGANYGKGNRYWLVGDVAFVTDKCGNTSCQVDPLYADATARTPLLTLDSAVTSGFAPPYPAPP
jgi:hypothetical protein